MKSEQETDKSETYMVLCHRCNAGFNAMEAQWCECDVPMRSVRCRSCGHCFCDARPSVKNAFWSRAPRALRQNTCRFGMAHPLFHLADTPAAEETVNAPLVVVVDDDESMRSLVASFVQQLGYRVVVATEPADAFVLAQDEAVRVLITDVLMPRVDGRELCRRLKASPGGADKKVIAMTSLFTARRFRAEAHNVFGVDGYLPKPINLSELSQLLAKFAPLRRRQPD